MFEFVFKVLNAYAAFAFANPLELAIPGAVLIASGIPCKVLKRVEGI